MTNIQTTKTVIGEWDILEFENRVRISYDGEIKTRVIFTGDGFTFQGKNPLKLTKTVQRVINGFMQDQCKSVKMSIWDVEAWTDYENTPIS